jgi:hypothetical protein
VTDALVGPVGPPEVHGARIDSVVPSIDGYEVTLETDGGSLLKVRFGGVLKWVGTEPEGMLVYVLNEWQLDPPQGFIGPLRRFVFVNWGEEDPRNLEVMASSVDFEFV